jgi:hypothetical protein
LWLVDKKQETRITEPTLGREFLGIQTDYVRVGRQAARAWNIGEPLYTMIRAHHSPRTVRDVRARKLLLVICLSSEAARTAFDETVDLADRFGAEPTRSRLNDLARLFEVSPDALFERLEQGLATAGVLYTLA